MKKLSDEEMKKIIGGNIEPPGGEELCLGCTTDQECAQVNKGKCLFYPNCNGGVHCCSGWTSCD